MLPEHLSSPNRSLKSNETWLQTIAAGGISQGAYVIK